jgi:hypothetical protein
LTRFRREKPGADRAGKGVFTRRSEQAAIAAESFTEVKALFGYIRARNINRVGKKTKSRDLTLAVD